MSEPFVAEVRILATDFAPRGWAFCDGQLLPISQNTALFSLIGTTYGGDGRSTTQLPDLRNRSPMHPGRGPGLADRRLGEKVDGSWVNAVTDATAERGLDSEQTSVAVEAVDEGLRRRPSLGLHFVIALAGLYPSRS